MNFNQLVSSMTFSDTPLRSFLNEFCVLTPELSRGEGEELLLTFSRNDYYTQGTSCYLLPKTLDKMIYNSFHKL